MHLKNESYMKHRVSMIVILQVQTDLAALNLEADMVGRAVKKATSERQQKLVDLDVRKLEVQHLREALNSRADEVFTLENRKLQLEQSLKERRHEISIHKCVASSTAAGRPYVSTEDSSSSFNESSDPRKIALSVQACTRGRAETGQGGSA
jgi:hypothetical protein